MSDPKSEAQAALSKSEDIRGVYEHRKGGTYVAYSVTLNEKTLRPMVHYRSIERGSGWSRTMEEWTEQVEGRPRFWRLRAATRKELMWAAGIEDET